MADTADILKYIVGELSERGFDTTKTALVKLLYLADVEAVRRGFERLSPVRWIYYKYGPYAFEVEETLRKIVGREVDETVRLSSLGKAYYLYRTLRYEIESRLSPEERAIVNQVLDRWGGESLARILNYVYFDTEPMAEAEWGEPLNLNVVERRTERVSLRHYLAARMDPEEVRRLADLKERFWTKAGAGRRDLVRPQPEPRYDETFLDGIELADQEERR